MLKTVSRIVCDQCGKESTPALVGESPFTTAEGEGWVVADLRLIVCDGVLLDAKKSDPDLCPFCVRTSTLLSKAESLLHKLETTTTLEFARGEEREEREALQAIVDQALAAA